MAQTYPNPITAAMCARIQDGTACTNPTPTYPTLATNPGAVYHPNVWAEKVDNHPGDANYGGAGWGNIPQTPADPDFVNVTLVAKSMNMPYG